MTDSTKFVSKQRHIGVVLSYLTMGLSTVISLVYTPYMLSRLSQSEFGLYQLIGSIAQYLSLLSMGLSGSYIRFYSKYKEEGGNEGVARLNGLYSFVFVIISIVAIIIGGIISNNLPVFFGRSMSSEELAAGKVMMLLMSVNTAITLPRTIFTGFISANEKFVFQRSVSLLYAILHPFACVIVLYFGGNAISLVIVSLIFTILIIAVEIIYSVKHIKFRINVKTSNLRELSSIFSFSFFVLLNDIINQLNWSIDKIILGVFSGTLSIAIYGLAAQLNTYFLQISTAISSVYAPQINQIIAQRDDEKRKNRLINSIFMGVGRIQFLVVLLVISGYIFFGREFIGIWAGPNYGDAYYIGLWLMIPVCVPLMQNTGIEIQRAKNKHKVRSIVYAIIAIFNVILSIPLCKIYGALGCAIGTAISLFAGNIVFINWYYYKHLDIDIPAFWKMIVKMIPGIVAPSIIGFIISRSILINNYYILGLCITIYSISYLISVWLIVLNSGEKEKIKKRSKILFRRIQK